MSMLMSFRECFREPSGIFRDRLQPGARACIHIFIQSCKSYFRDCFRRPSGTFRDRRAFKEVCSTHVNVVCALVSMLMSFRECFREPSGIFRDRLQPDTRACVRVFIHSYKSYFRIASGSLPGPSGVAGRSREACSTHVNLVCILMSMLMSFRECFREPSGIFRDRLQPDTHTYIHIFIHSYKSYFRDCFRKPSGNLPGSQGIQGRACSTHVNVVCMLM